MIEKVIEVSNVPEWSQTLKSTIFLRIVKFYVYVGKLMIYPCFPYSFVGLTMPLKLKSELKLSKEGDGGRGISLISGRGSNLMAR